MFNTCVGSPKLAAFDCLWHIDFEYRQNSKLLPIPVSLYAINQRTGEEIFCDRNELLALRRPPFGIGARDLIIAYAANAEMQCFLQLGWPMPAHILDLYLETSALTNGDNEKWPHRKWRPGLLEALAIFDLQGIDAGEKEEMRNLILNNENYTPEQWLLIRNYNRSDDIATSALLDAVIDRLDMPRALHRGRYQKAVAIMETLGLPTGTASIAEIFDNWIPLQLDFILRYDVGEFYNGSHFVERRLFDLVIQRGWETHWPLTPTLEFKTDNETLSRMAALHPELTALAKLRGQLNSFRMPQLVSSIGSDGYARCPLKPFATWTSRNQPSGRDRIFIPALPQWLHGVIKPPLGWACAEIDWATQEVAIMAALSGDPNMIADYLRGDCHSEFAIRAGLITDETESEYRTIIRNKQAKPVVLGSNYGMTPYGIQRKTKRSWAWSKHIHRQHREIYPVFHAWLDDVVTEARFGQHIESVFGWPSFVSRDISMRSLMNFPAQSGGADMMRHAAIMATEAGLAINCPVHDSFRLMAPIEDLPRTLRDMEEIMRVAGAAVTGSFEVPAEVKSTVIYPQHQGDVFKPDKDRGHATWTEVRSRLASGDLMKYRGLFDDDAEETAKAS
jgi:hypothetical protein